MTDKYFVSLLVDHGYEYFSSHIPLQKERKILENKRLDLDAAKGKLRKTKSPEANKLVSQSKKLPNTPQPPLNHIGI